VPVATDLGDTGLKLLDVAVDPTSCRIYAVANGFYELNPTDGSSQYIGSFNEFGPPNALEFDRSGQAYAWNVSWQFFKINKSTGTGTYVTQVRPSAWGDVAVDVDGTMYGAAYGSLVRINPTNWTTSIVGPFDIPAVYGLEIDVDGTMYASSGDKEFKLYRIGVAGNECAGAKCGWSLLFNTRPTRATADTLHQPRTGSCPFELDVRLRQ
jgi:hypothetical protein